MCFTFLLNSRRSAPLIFLWMLHWQQQQWCQQVDDLVPIQTFSVTCYNMIDLTFKNTFFLRQKLTLNLATVGRDKSNSSKRLMAFIRNDSISSAISSRLSTSESMESEKGMILHRGKSFLELWVTTFLPDWQPPLIFVWFTSKSHDLYPHCKNTCTRSLR